jgi:tryptophanase
MTFNVYERYFEAECTYNGVERKAADVLLIVTSEGGEVAYEYAVNFFPHRDEEDFAVSYDAYASREIYRAKGRRSKKREACYLGMLEQEADALAGTLGGKIFWDKPLIPERRG